jgi:hypothetical protein
MMLLGFVGLGFAGYRGNTSPSRMRAANVIRHDEPRRKRA